jgi:hypothetical protein
MELKVLAEKIRAAEERSRRADEWEKAKEKMKAKIRR